MEKPRLSFWQIWNMSFGFLGIQFGFALQGGFMSNIFTTLGASKEQIPGLWIAAPLTGLIVQPIIGYLSDNTWHPLLGRRRPFFLIGAILASITLLFVPYSPELWVAAGCLWMLDASINISMEPFRALVADKLNESQRSYGFVVQTLIIGIGTWVASNLPRMIEFLGVNDTPVPGEISTSVKWAFAIGAGVYLLSIVYTILTTSEYPPEDLEQFKREKEKRNRMTGIREIIGSIKTMPKVMKQLGVIQFFSWFAFFTMWSLANPALTEFTYRSPAPVETEFDLSDSHSSNLFTEARVKYDRASNLVGSNMGIYGLTSMAFALLLTFYTAKKHINRRNVHMAALLLGSLGFLTMYWLRDPSYLVVSFGLIGIAWGSILSMPYAMLSSSIQPKKMGIYMGLFNMFIVMPQIVAALGVNEIFQFLLGNNIINAMILSGISLLLAAVSCLLIRDKNVITYQPTGN